MLCIHGMPGTWRQAIPLAEDLAGSFEIILPSRPGHGRTPIRVGRGYVQQADAYAALLEALGIDACAIVGISGGAPSAIAFASRHADRTRALVLACALAPHLVTATPRSWKLFRVPGLAEIAMPPVRAVNRWRTRRPRDEIDVVLTRNLTPDERARAGADRQIRDDLLRHVLAHQEAPPPVAGLRNDYAQVERATAAFAGSVSCPALVLHGKADTAVPLSHASFYANAIPGAELKIFEDAGHRFMLTRRSETTNAVRTFLQQTALG